MNAVLKTLLLLSLVATVSSQNRPPSIILGSLKNEYYLDNALLICVASGTPPPKYDWFKDGFPFNLNQNGVSLIGGNLSMRAPALAEGYYQCSASNAFGTARSNTTRLRQMRLGVATTVGSQTQTAKRGTTFRLPCTLQQGQTAVPSAIYKWETVVSESDSNPQVLSLDQRLQIDDNGTLTFSYVVSEDRQNNRLYRCHLINTRLNALETSVAYTYLNIDETPFQPIQLTTLFNYSWPTIALERESVSLRCFFGGAQDISISWKKPDGSAPGGARYRFDRSLMQIIGVQKADEGLYTCTGTSSSGLPLATATINVVVQSAPIFLDINDGPHDINVTNGDNVVVNCNAYANASATVDWYMNGQLFDSNSLPRKFKLSADKKTLTISNVCKSCTDGTVAGSDLMVIQCNASNANGYTFGNGYINVLDRTKITVPPESMELRYPNPIILICSADHDVSTPVTYRWLLNGNKPLDGFLNTSVDGTLYIDVSNDENRGLGYKGTWMCNATNGVSYDAKPADVYLPSASTASVQWWWWILLIVILLLLLFIALVFLICCCIHQNRGEAYPVDKEERKGGNDPDKELQDIGFHDFQRPTDEPDGVSRTPFEHMRKGPGSISSSIGKGVSDDEMSLDNYANVNPGKFSEDGSFIGQYNPNRRIIQMQPGIPESTA